MNRIFKLFILITFLSLNNKSYSQTYSYKFIDIKKGLSQMKVSSICEDSLGYIWIGTRNGLNRYNGDKIKVFSTENGLPSNRILALTVDSTNRLVILTSKGLSYYNGAEFETYTMNFPRVDYNITTHNGHIYMTDLSNIWEFKNGDFNKVSDINIDATFNTFDFDSIEQTQNKLVYSFTAQHDTINDINVNKIIRPSTWFKDKSNNFWVGSDNGVHLFEPNLFYHFDNNTLPSIWSIYETNEAVWLGSYGSGLFKVKVANNQDVTNITKGKMFNHFHQGIDEDKNGNLYFSNAFTLIKNKEGKFESLKDWFPTFGIKYDSKRSQMVCGVLKGFMTVSENDDLEIFTDTSLVHKNHYIMSVTIDNNNTYWMGSYSGLTRYDPDTQTSEFFTRENGKLPKGQSIFTGYVDSHKNLWLGGDEGIMLFSQGEGILKSIDSQLLNRQVKAIVEIDSTHLLINTKDQLIVFNHYEFTNSGNIETSFINESNSYKGYEPGFDGLFKDSKDKIWVLSGGSVDILDASKINYNQKDLKVRISKVNDQVTCTNFTNIINVDTIKITNEKVVSFEIEAIGKVRPTQLLYRYKYNNEEWSMWSDNARFQLKNVAHGLQLIQVEVGPTDKEPNSQAAKLYLDVKLDIYKRAFFIPLILGCLLCAFLLVGYYIFKSRRERKLYLSQLEESRYLKSQLLLSEMNPHFIFNVLASIQNKILIGDKESANHKLIQLSTLMRNFLLTSYKGNQPKKTFENEITIKREIELLTSYLDFEKSNSNDQFTYSIEYDTALEIDQIMIPPMIIQPYVENAVKHGILPKGDSGSIKVFFELFTDRLICKVIDNGVGIQPITTSSLPNTKHKSLGSKLVRERVKLLNDLGYKISIETKSKIGEGTEVEIIIYDKF